MKKVLLLVSLCLLFTSCWIEPPLGNWEQDGDTYYFEDFDTMSFTIRPIINKTFTDWHWSKETFQAKYNQYLNNISSENNYADFFVNNKSYEFKVIKGNSSSAGISNGNKKSTIICNNADGERVYINGDYFLIVRKNGDAAVFFSKGIKFTNLQNQVLQNN